MARIYVSSTYRDLTDYREEVYRTLRKMNHDAVAMEDYVATDERPLHRCLSDVDACDVYVGIFARRYGYRPPEGNPGQRSITELEYRRAARRGKPCLVFLLDPKAPWLEEQTDNGAEKTRIDDLRRELEKDRLVSYFQSADELAKLVSVAVGQWERSQLTSRARSWWTSCQEWLAATVFARRNTKRYLRNLVAQHREFTFLGRAKPLELENIYVSLKVGEYTPRALRPDGPAAPSAEQPDAPSVAGRTVEIPEALSLSRRLTVLGDPGSGKTTLLKYLVLQIAQRDARLEAFARALNPTRLSRLLERLCRFLSGLTIFTPAIVSSVAALVVWLVQAVRYDMTVAALVAWVVLLISLFLLLFRLWRSGIVVGVILGPGLLAYAGWWQPGLVGPTATGLAGIAIGVWLYPFWIRPPLALLKAVLRHSTRYPVPVYLTLNNLARDPRSVETHLTEALSDVGFPHAREFLRRKLRRGECMLLLDALDEVVDQDSQNRVVSELNRLRSAYGSGNQIIATSRRAGAHHTLDGYLKLEVQEFDQAQIERFARSWFADTADPATRTRSTDGLLQALRRSPRMRLLASNPLLLSLITLLYEQNWNLPERRVELYEECLVLLIADWDRLRRINRAPRFSPEQKRKALTAVAVRFHEAETRVFGHEKLLAALEALHPSLGHDDESPIDFLDEIIAHTGLLRQKSRSSYDFVHLTFQEFLTATAYHERGDAETLLGHSGEAWWREVIRLYAALEGDATAFLERLRHEDLFLAAECLADSRVPETSAFHRVAEALVSELKRLVREDPNRCQQAADALAEIAGWGATTFLGAVATESKEQAEIAVAALLALAQANESVVDALFSEVGPLLRLLHGHLPVSAPALRPRLLSLLDHLGHPLVFVPSGEFLMGTPGEESNECQQHRVTLTEYWIDKYPVTNAQYARFVQETGHPQRGSAFTTGKERHPVVNVSWEDADAYAKWCDKQLPTEAQWEKAARGTDGRTYPWGNEWDGNRCNVSGYGTTPVGNYPQGVSPYGCHDMSGNVQDWVADWYGEDY